MFSLNDVLITFDQFESLSQNIFQQLKILYISISNNIAYMNANRWKRYILTTMPLLSIFDFMYANSVHLYDEPRYETLIN